MDFIYVNILNEGQLPYLREKGPLFGYRMAVGVYSILSRDHRLKIEVTTPENAEKRKAEYLKSKEPKLKEVVETKEELVIDVVDTQEVTNTESTTTEPVQDQDDVDTEIDKVLNENPNIESAIVVNLKDDLDVDNTSEIEEASDSVEFKIYSNNELKSMTKAQLRQILKDRGYTTGVYAPKYQDNLEQLRTKVKKTQQK